MSKVNWQKSSYSGSGESNACIELASIQGQIHLRESDSPDVIVTTTSAKLRAFILSIKAGEFDSRYPD